MTHLKQAELLSSEPDSLACQNAHAFPFIKIAFFSPPVKQKKLADTKAFC